jgi:hypothetical protein
MAGIPYLIDSNILLRWLQPIDPDYAAVEAALNSLARQEAIFCYTSQNLAEFWNACTRPADRNGYGLSLSEADRRARIFEGKLRLLLIACWFIKNGEDCSWIIMSLGLKCTMLDWLQRCGFIA